MLLQSQKPSLRPQTTAHLAQTMSLLELSGEELRQKLENALASNPALELVEEARCPHCHRILPRNGPCMACSCPPGNPSAEAIVFVSPRSDFTPLPTRPSGEYTPPEEWTASAEDLPTFVLRQIVPELKQTDRTIAAHILTSLDEDGLLTISLLEIARYHHVQMARVEEVLALIQRAEPVGVGSPSPQEALLVQLEVLAETRPVPALAAQAIQEGMELLSRHAYLELGRLLKTTASEAKQITTFISENLNPYPGRAHWGSHSQSQNHPDVYHHPDIIITQYDHIPEMPLVVEIISPYAGSLRVSPLYRQALAQAAPEKLEGWLSDLENATLLVKCLQQRDHTLVRLMQRLVDLQGRFILEGDAYMQPITRAQLADELGVHESTVSRAVSSKAVQLPNRRIIPLAKMFDRSLHIRTLIKEIIAEEDTPLSDQQITAILHERGFQVARRTVAKYRTMEGILPARMRHSNNDQHKS